MNKQRKEVINIEIDNNEMWKNMNIHFSINHERTIKMKMIWSLFIKWNQRQLTRSIQMRMKWFIHRNYLSKEIFNKLIQSILLINVFLFSVIMCWQQENYLEMTIYNQYKTMWTKGKKNRIVFFPVSLFFRLLRFFSFHFIVPISFFFRQWNRNNHFSLFWFLKNDEKV